MGNYKHSASLCQKAKLLLKLCGITEGLVHMALKNTSAELVLIKTEYNLARSIQLEIVDKTSPEKGPFNLAFAHANLAHIDIMTGAEGPQVLEHVEKSRSLFTALKVLAGLAYCDLLEADLELRDGNPVTVRAVFMRILNTYRGKNKDVTTYCLERLADPVHWGGSASDWTTIFVAHATLSGNKLQICEALRRLGDIFLLENDVDTARSVFQAALDGFTQMDIHRSRGECLQRLGDIQSLKEDSQGAIQFWKQARASFEQSFQAKSVKQIDERLRRVYNEDQVLVIDGEIDQGSHLPVLQ
ncbi:hypothetical protein FB45DRAFT_869259 [Roridomyces roridus]|uniref:Uncharacterized protein n=1 Tax=Roridomyces roridus TaxID=1738132 RepID=A0AAD7BNL5_9AGAR|nr:hypothetical protein FB45DRAFT_869259 [Roridomyces roridus]